MFTARIRNIEEYSAHRTSNAHVYNKTKEIEDALYNRYKGLPNQQNTVSGMRFISRLFNISKLRKAIKNNSGEIRRDITTDPRAFTVKGFSYPAQAEVDFIVDFQYSDNININWRERVICPITKLNNRLRAAVHFIDFELDIDKNSIIYIAEQLTPLYSFLKKKYINIIGSEYLGATAMSGFVNDKGIRHEDATRLSFADESIDYYLSFECFEHIPEFVKAFEESYRVLRKNGMMLWTVPFSSTSIKNIIRAKVTSGGTVNHIMEPEYHGDPVNSDKGILCYQYFGWEMFDQLRDLGFRDAYAITYWSDSLGYYNGEQFIFCARK